MENAIEFNNVWKKFKKGEKFNSLRDSIPNMIKRMTSGKAKSEALEGREFWAVKDVNFTVKKGEVIGIMGPNGAGKSTILKLLSRIMIPNKGSMKIKGKLSALIEVTAGFHPELTGRENVYLNGTILGMSRREIECKFDEIVAFSGVEEFIDTPVKRYSSGMYSRLGFSVASHMDPDVLLVDEVLSVGDIAFQAKCAQKMRELMKSGTTIILVSHHLAMIQSLCKRVILLEHGQVLKDGPVDEIVPIYQNIVSKNSEEEFKRKLIASGERVGVSDERLVEVKRVVISNEKGEETDGFQVGEDISFDIEYVTSSPIEAPVFIMQIVRSDGVVCCRSRSDENGIDTVSVNAKGKISVKFQKSYLAPGIYMANFSMWDKQLIHPYIIHNKDVFRVNSTMTINQTDMVFVPRVAWNDK
ncbi:ABC transporter ATP-binding protein [Candidatus Omnitrophota bacterium]